MIFIQFQTPPKFSFVTIFLLVFLYFLKVASTTNETVLIKEEELTEEKVNDSIAGNITISGENFYGENGTNVTNKEEDNEPKAPFYALDYRKALNLSLAEQNISARLNFILTNYHFRDHVQKDNRCRRRIQSYLVETGKDIASFKHYRTRGLPIRRVPDNPLLLYRMISRLLVTLSDDVLHECDHIKKIDDIVQGALSANNVSFPTEDDLNDALLGVLRIHYVYKFNATGQLRLGIFEDIDTNVKLTVDDCLGLATYSMKNGANVLAYQWLLSANLTLAEEIRHNHFTNVETASKNLNRSWKDFLEIAELNSTEFADYKFEHKKETNWSSVDFYPVNYYATCRGESKLTERQKSRLFCYTDNRKHPYFILSPLKIEILHKNPPLVQFHDFIRDKMINYIKKLSYANFSRSEVEPLTAVDNRIINSGRTSLTTWIDDAWEGPNSTLDKELVELIKKIEFATGYHALKTEASDAFQVVSYSSLGGHYDFHDDAFGIESIINPNGDRLATFFLFLSKVAMGGYTGFRKLGVFAKPVKGSAILWYSTYRNGSPDRRTTHAGCPLVLGSKIAANKWIKQYENMFRFQCTTPEE